MAESKLPYFFLGVGVGAAVAVLFTPVAGEDLRHGLRDRASGGRDFVRRRGGELGERVRSRASGLVDRGREVVESHRGDLEAALEAGRRAYRDATGPQTESPTDSAPV